MGQRIRLLCTSDIHGSVMPARYADRSTQNLGVARLKTMIDELRDEDTIVIDNGDTIEGNALTFYHFMHQAGQPCPVSRAMGAVGYDYVNVGNHDFNEGQEALFLHLDTMKAPCITSNFHIRGESFGGPFVIREICGKKVAIFGVTTQYIPHWENPANLKDITFPDAYETAKQTTQTLLALSPDKRPDYIVCVYHGGFERDPATGVPGEKDTGENEGYRILTIPGIDVLLSGHQHRTFCGTAQGTAYTQPAADGRYLAVVDIDTVTGEITPSLREADADPDEGILSLIRKEEEACQKWLDTTLGTCEIDLKVKDEADARLHKSQVITFFNHVQQEVTGADLSASALFLGATGFDREITMRDLVSTYLFPNTLTVKRVTGAVLRAYLEKSAQFWALDENGEVCVNPAYDFPTPGHYNYDMVDGIEYTIKVSRPEGQRIVSLTRNGKEVADDDVFTLAVNNYRAAGGGDYDMIADAPTVKEYLTSMVEILASYIMTHPVIDFTPVSNIQVIA